MNLTTHYSMDQLTSILPVQYLREQTMLLHENGLPSGLKTGIKELDAKFRLDLGMLATITGVPGSGKSEFVDFLVTLYNRHYGYKAVIFSPETQPVCFHTDKFIRKLTNRKITSLTESELNDAMEYIGDNYFFCNYATIHSLDAILENAEMLARERDAKILVLDPYNRIESEKPSSMDETTFISKVLDKLSAFARKNNMLVLLVAHPRKMYSPSSAPGSRDTSEETSTYYCPNPYDINGSANFFNKSDFVVAVHTKSKNDGEPVLIKCDKVKFLHYGEGGACKLKYDKLSGNYYSDGGRFITDPSELIPAPFVFPHVEYDQDPLNVQVSMYRNVYDKEGATGNLKEFLFTKKYQPLIENIRSEASPEKRHDKKTEKLGDIPGVTVSGLFSERNAQSVTKRSGLMCVDIDWKENCNIMERVPEIVKGLGYIIYMAKSCSGDGYFAICKISNPELHEQHFQALRRDFATLGIQLDKNCSDISRLRLASYDDSPYYNPNAYTYCSVYTEKPEKKLASSSKRQFDGTREKVDTVADLDRKIETLQRQGGTIADAYGDWRDLGMSLMTLGEPLGREYYHKLSALSPNKYNPSECDQQYDELLSHYSANNQFSIGTAIKMINDAIS